MKNNTKLSLNKQTLKNLKTNIKAGAEKTTDDKLTPHCTSGICPTRYTC